MISPRANRSASTRSAGVVSAGSPAARSRIRTPATIATTSSAVSAIRINVGTHLSGREATRSTVIADYAADRDPADRRLAEALAGSAAVHPDVMVERPVLHDLDVAYTLERASQRGRLLVAGMGRNGRFAELIYGSLGLSMMRRSACPVLLVPTTGRTRFGETTRRRSRESGPIDPDPWPGPRLASG